MPRARPMFPTTESEEADSAAGEDFTDTIADANENYEEGTEAASES